MYITQGHMGSLSNLTGAANNSLVDCTEIAYCDVIHRLNADHSYSKLPALKDPYY
jgi:hypothetical protein